MHAVVSWFISLPTWDKEAVRLALVVASCFVACGPFAAVLRASRGGMERRWMVNALICGAVALYFSFAALVTWFALSVMRRQNLGFFDAGAKQDHWVVIIAGFNGLITLLAARGFWRRRGL